MASDVVGLEESLSLMLRGRCWLRGAVVEVEVDGSLLQTWTGVDVNGRLSKS